MSELKKCPFCGEEAIMHKHTLRNIDWYLISCSKCNITQHGGYKPKEKAIEAWNTRADGWISVKDRLPEENEFVLIKVNGMITNYFYDIAERIILHGQELFVSSDTEYEIKRVTHWQPLPEPPKGD